MPDIETLVSALDVIERACRPRGESGPRRGEGLTVHQVGILGLLDPEEPVMVTELAEHVRVTPSTMSLTLKRLELRGYVRRERDPSDRRVVNVLLTGQGEHARRASGSLDRDRVDRLLLLLDAGARTTALRGLELLSRAAAELLRRERAHLGASKVTRGQPFDGTPPGGAG